MQLIKYRTLPYPQNIWSTIYDKEIPEIEIPEDWQATLNYAFKNLRNPNAGKILEHFFRDRLTLNVISGFFGSSRESVHGIASNAIKELQLPKNQWYFPYGIQKAMSTPDIQPIHTLDLSPRAINCLLRAHITTVGLLIKQTEAELLMLPGFGIITLAEVKRKLAAKGLSLCAEHTNKIEVD